MSSERRKSGTGYAPTVRLVGASTACAVALFACGGGESSPTSGASGNTGAGAVQAVSGGGNGGASVASGGVGNGGIPPGVGGTAGAGGTPVPSGGASGNAGAAPGGTAGVSNGTGGAGGTTQADGGTPLPTSGDPGTAPWTLVPTDQVLGTCKLDPTKLAAAEQSYTFSWAVVRYGVYHSSTRPIRR